MVKANLQQQVGKSTACAEASMETHRKRSEDFNNDHQRSGKRQRITDEDKTQLEEQRELEFNRKQNRIRTHIRLQQNRPHIIDMLAKNTLYYTHVVHGDNQIDYAVEQIGSMIHIDQDRPDQIIEKVQENHILHNLQQQIVQMIELRQDLEYWKSCLVVCKYVIQKLKSHTEENAVYEDINEMLTSKSMEELDQLEESIDAVLAGNTDAAVDMDYWVQLKSQLNMFKAKSFLKKYHNDCFQHFQQNAASLIVDDDAVNAIPNLDSEFKTKELPQKQQTTDPIAAIKSKLKLRDGETFFDDVVEDSDASTSSTLARPKYINRVNMGFDWNRYNQIHYDEDNPPPKVVNGYKFRIFYPDLESSITPKYKVRKDPNDSTGSMSIITFKAGPPYQDISFRITSGRWETSHRRGFECKFENGVLYLSFYLRRFRYRR